MSLEHSPARGRKSDPLELIRARELAELLGIHIITVWKWAKAGKLPKPVKLSDGVTAWRRSDIEAWLAERAAQTD